MYLHDENSPLEEVIHVSCKVVGVPLGGNLDSDETMPHYKGPKSESLDRSLCYLEFIFIAMVTFNLYHDGADRKQ